MSRLLLAAVPHAHGAAVAHSLSGGHLFWLGVALGLVVGLIPLIPWWAKMVGLAVAILSAGIVHVGHGAHVTPGITLWLIVGLVGLGVGLFFGRVRGLQHLGTYELRNRSGFIRTISRF